MRLFHVIGIQVPTIGRDEGVTEAEAMAQQGGLPQQQSSGARLGDAQLSVGWGCMQAV